MSNNDLICMPANQLIKRFKAVEISPVEVLLPNQGNFAAL